MLAHSGVWTRLCQVESPPAGKGVVGLLSWHGSHFWVCITFCKVRHGDSVTKPDYYYYYYWVRKCQTRKVYNFLTSCYFLTSTSHNCTFLTCHFLTCYFIPCNFLTCYFHTCIFLAYRFHARANSSTWQFLIYLLFPVLAVSITCLFATTIGSRLCDFVLNEMKILNNNWITFGQIPLLFSVDFWLVFSTFRFFCCWFLMNSSDLISTSEWCRNINLI